MQSFMNIAEMNLKNNSDLIFLYYFFFIVGFFFSILDFTSVCHSHRSQQLAIIQNLYYST